MSLLDRIITSARAPGKALADLHPEVNERTHVMTVLYGTESVNWTAYSYLNGIADYEAHVWVRKAITLIAQNFASLPIEVIRDAEPDEKHPLARLLTDVNDKMSSVELWEQWIVDLLLGGEEGWELVRDKRGNYVEIWPRTPNTIYIIPDKARLRYYDVVAYRIDDGLPAPDGSARTGYSLPPDEFLFAKFYNPRNRWRGIAPITAVRNGILIDQFAQAWSKLFFTRSARPDYAVIAPSGLTPGEREDLIKQLQLKHGGVAHAHEPIVLEQGVTDIKPIDFRPKDIEWLTQRQVARDEIGAIFGVPDILMGFGNDNYDTEEKRNAAATALWTLTIIPLISHRDTMLTEYFRRQRVLTPAERVQTNLSGVTALRKNFLVLGQAAQVYFQMGYPVNVVNRVLGLGFPDIPGGDVGYLPLSLIAVTGAGEKSASATSRGAAITVQRKAFPKYGSDEHRQLWERFVAKTESQERAFGKVVAGLLRKQQAEILKRLRGGKDWQSDARDVADNPFDREAWEEEFIRVANPTFRNIVAAAGQGALDDIGIAIAFDILEPAVLEFLRQRGQRFAEAVNDTTWEQLKESLAAGLKEGEGIPELVGRVEAIMGDRIRSSGETIARTEVIGASNGGTLLAWQQSGVVAKKVWLAALDDRTRETHAGAHGQTVDIDGDFEVGGGRGPTPGQIGIAAEDINCRCTMIAKLRELALAPGSNGRQSQLLYNA